VKDSIVKLKVGILQADDVVPHLAQKYGEYPAMFQQLLSAVNDDQKVDLEFETYAVNAGNYPADLDEVDAYILTGSKSSVYEDAPWIVQLAEFVRALHSRKKKLVGVCFGHQMVAHALGGETRLAKVGWSLGVKETSPIGSNLLGNAPFNLIYSHQDQITVPVAGTVVLASTDTCPIAATSLGEHILTFQGHPEFYPDYSSELYEFRRENYPPETYQKAMDSFQENVDQLLVAKMIIDFCLD
jgi:GMP synthase-like glutamine amidotransferase